MLTTFTIKAGDTDPKLAATLYASNGVTLVDLSATTVMVHLRGYGTRLVALNAAAEIVDAPAGKVRFPGDLGTLLVPGVYEGEWQVTWPDATVMTFPNASYFLIRVLEEVA